MKTLKSSFASRVRLYVGALIAMLLVGSVVQSGATPTTESVSAGGILYAITYDPSQSGFTEWSANGANQLALQSLYYSINSGPVSLLTSAIVNGGSSGFTSKYITATYSISGGSIADTMTINGNTLSESIQFNNLGSSGVDISIFQYSDFVLGGATGSQTVNMTQATVVGGYATTSQTGGGLTLGWQGHAPGFTTLVQASGTGNPFGAFVGSGDLDNTSVTAINTQAVFGYEFSGTVAGGNLLSISENSTFPVVPEPSSLALISSGMLGAALMLRRQRNKKA